MATRTVINFDQQTSLTTTSDNFIVTPNQDVAVAATLTSGTPATGCKVQVTLDEVAKISAGTAVWVDSPLGAHLTTSAEKVLRPVTGVRLSVTDGTWTFQVRQTS